MPWPSCPRPPGGRRRPGAPRSVQLWSWCFLCWLLMSLIVWATDLATQEGGREYVRIAREGAEDEVAEVPTNSDGKLPIQTVTVRGN